MSRVLILLALLLWASPAAADPLSALIAIGSAFIGGSVTAATLATALLRGLVKAGISLIVAKITQRKQKAPGIQASQTTTGGTDPQASIFGRFATKGHLVYHNSHSENHKWLVHVIELGDIPGATLRRLIIDGEYSELGEQREDWGREIVTKTDGDTVHGYIQYFDGHQTEASPYLVEHFADDEDRPWTPLHVLSGVPYVVLSFRRSDKMFPNGVPNYTFEVDGPPLYDPRRDSTAGGNGTHRFDAPGTWEQTVNLMVIAYNVFRGIALPDGRVWGGGFSAEELPFDEWAAAMDACDAVVGGNNRRQFIGGFEVKFEEEPADFLDEVFAAANAQIVEIGGAWYPRVGVAAEASATVTGDDLLVSDTWQHDPFPGLESTFNAVTITYSSPAALWEASTLETLVMPEWVAEDGRQKLFELRLPMVFRPEQARQLAHALLQENRRFKTHRLPLPGEYARLRPLENIRLTLPEFGYEAKLFRITEAAYDLQTLNVSLSLRECDPIDFDAVPSLELPELPQPPATIPAVDAGVLDFAVAGYTVRNVLGEPFAPALRFTWNPVLSETCEGLTFQVRIAGSEEYATMSTASVEEGAYIAQPVVPGATYEVRAKALARKRKTKWTLWLTASAPNVLLTPDRFDPSVFDALDARATDTFGRLSGNIQTALEGLAESTLGSLLDDALEGARLEDLLGDLRSDTGALIEETGLSLSSEVQGVRAELQQNYVTGASQTQALSALSTTLSAQIGAVQSSLTQNYVTHATQTSALASLSTTLSAQVEGVRAYANQTFVSSVTHSSALSALNTSLSAEIGAVRSYANQTFATSATLNEATSAFETALSSGIGGVNAKLNSQYYTRAQTNSAISAATNTVQTSLNGLSTTVSQVQSSVDGITGVYAVQIDNNGVVAGFSLISDIIDGAPVSEMLFDVDRFVIGKSGTNGSFRSVFTITDGQAFLKNVAIQDAAISTAKIRDLNVETLKLADQSVSVMRSATGGTGDKTIAITNNSGATAELLVLAVVRAIDYARALATAGVTLHKATSATGTGQIGSLVDVKTGESDLDLIAEISGTGIATTTIANGLTRYIRAVGVGNVSQLDLIVFQRMK